jgi:hypothetical protein
MNALDIKEDVAVAGKAIAAAPGKIIIFLKTLGEVPDHIWHLCILGLGSLLAMHGQKELGGSLVVAGIGMFKGQSK